MAGYICNYHLEEGRSFSSVRFMVVFPPPVIGAYQAGAVIHQPYCPFEECKPYLAGMTSIRNPPDFFLYQCKPASVLLTTMPEANRRFRVPFYPYTPVLGIGCVASCILPQYQCPRCKCRLEKASVFSRIYQPETGKQEIIPSLRNDRTRVGPGYGTVTRPDRIGRFACFGCWKTVVARHPWKGRS